MSKQLTDTEESAEEQAQEAGSNTTGDEVEPESNDDMTLFGNEKKPKKQ